MRDAPLRSTLVATPSQGRVARVRHLDHPALRFTGPTAVLKLHGVPRSMAGVAPLVDALCVRARGDAEHGHWTNRRGHGQVNMAPL